MLIAVKHFEEQLQQLQLEYSVDTNTKLLLMTIHKAKGLEFNMVIVPNLHQIIPYNHYP